MVGNRCLQGMSSPSLTPLEKGFTDSFDRILATGRDARIGHFSQARRFNRQVQLTGCVQGLRR